jgi:putative colanic acid biosynthesis UDP-glucose lipid carrier transferase
MPRLAKAAEVHLIKFKYVPDLSDYTDCLIDLVNDSPILSLSHQPSESFTGQIKKRVFDILFSSIIIVFVLSWLLPILALIIKLDSEGPVLFIQMRSGKNNRPFRCIKLRSLTINRDADTLQVSRNDTRITKVGRFLRRSSLDELPQFFNVFFGNMSIVGSRPHMLKHTEEYSKMEDTYMLRHLLKPGVTGWAQINGHRGEIKHKEQLTKRIQHDIWYIENWNIWLDIKIVFATISLTFKGDENAF